ncbi:hypothetical protein M5E89_06065 [Acidaminococcus intestini]|nr:hypothetical protein M5E89_06065 [Acidaminococcus intestini]
MGLLLLNVHMVQENTAFRVGYINDIAFMNHKGSPDHGKSTLAFFRIAAHGLIDHDSLRIFFLDCFRAHQARFIHGAFQTAVRKGNTIFAFNNGPFRMGRTQSRSCYGNICCGVDGRGSMSLGLKRAASNADRSAPRSERMAAAESPSVKTFTSTAFMLAPPVV